MASKSKSSRIGTVLASLADTWHDFCRNIKKDGEARRQNTADVLSHVVKLHQLLSSQEKCCKTMLTSHRSEIPLLFDILQYYSKIDCTVCGFILDSLHCLCSTPKRISFLNESGLVCILTECLVSATNTFINIKEPQQLEDTFYYFHILLHKLGSKDKRVATLSRLSGAVSASVVVLKTYDINSKVFYPVLQVMKLYSSSTVNCNIMAKGSVVTSLTRLIPICGQKKVQLLKLCLELLAVLCKSKTAAKKAISQGTMPVLLDMFQDWHKNDIRNRQLALRKTILSVIRSCVGFGFGKKSFLSADGFRILYFLGLEAIERKEFEQLLRLLSLILRKCVRNKDIPLKSQSSVYSFALPSSAHSLLLSSGDKSNSDLEEEVEAVASSDDEEEGDGEGDEGRTATRQQQRNSDEETEEIEEEIMLSQDCPSHLQQIDTSTSQYKSNFNDFPSHHSTTNMVDDVDVDLDMRSSETDRFRELLHELYIYKDEDTELHVKASPIRIPTAVIDTSIESSEHNSTTESHDDNHSPCKLNTSFMERLKGFNIVDSSVELCDDVIDSCNHDDDNSIFQNGGDGNHNGGESNVWNVEESRVDFCPDPDGMSTTPVNYRRSHACSLKNSQCNAEHVLEFVKVPEPSLYGHVPPSNMEPLATKKMCIQRQMLFSDLSRQIFPERVANRVVFDLDELTKNTPPITPNVSAHRLHPSPSSSSTRIIPVLRKSQSAPRLSLRHCPSTGPLKDDIEKTKALSFESRFECGNLRKAIQIRQHEYDLILNSDANTSQHHQWFYFQVEEMEADIEYRFNIINCEKANSQFNYGMCPLLYSVTDAKRGEPCWERTGSNICYYRNYFTRGATSLRSYYTATFTISFPYKNDTCYLAYHYPYSLSMLKIDMARLECSLSRIIFTNQVICRTLGGNDVNLLTITNPSLSGVRRDIFKRPYVMLTARVHPGETNSSWIMKGIMDFLVSSDTIARQLRSIFIFKIVPMLNPDGVVNGCHRCSLTGQDLNRHWKDPDPVLHPSIYHTKSLIKTMIKCGKKPTLFVDFHGHSRKKNVFMYGCHEKPPDTEGESTTKQRSTAADVDIVENFSTWDFCSQEPGVKLFPRIMSSISPYFSVQNCNYTMDKSKESTARIVGFRELGIERSYTLESSYCGMDQGEYAGLHMGTSQLEDVGKTFCKALFKFAMCPSVDITDS